MSWLLFLSFLIFEAHARQCGPLPNDIYVPKGEKRQLHFWTNGEDFKESEEILHINQQSVNEEEATEVPTFPVENEAGTAPLNDAMGDHPVTITSGLIDTETNHDVQSQLTDATKSDGIEDQGLTVVEVLPPVKQDEPIPAPVTINEPKLPNGPVHIHAVEATSEELNPVEPKPVKKTEASSVIFAAVVEDEATVNPETLEDSHTGEHYLEVKKAPAQPDENQNPDKVAGESADSGFANEGLHSISSDVNGDNQIAAEPKRVVDTPATANIKHVISSSADLAESVHAEKDSINTVITVDGEKMKITGSKNSPAEQETIASQSLDTAEPVLGIDESSDGLAVMAEAVLPVKGIGSGNDDSLESTAAVPPRVTFDEVTPFEDVTTVAETVPGDSHSHSHPVVAHDLSKPVLHKHTDLPFLVSELENLGAVVVTNNPMVLHQHDKEATVNQQLSEDMLFEVNQAKPHQVSADTHVKTDLTGQDMIMAIIPQDRHPLPSTTPEDIRVHTETSEVPIVFVNGAGSHYEHEAPDTELEANTLAAGDFAGQNDVVTGSPGVQDTTDFPTSTDQTALFDVVPQTADVGITTDQASEDEMSPQGDIPAVSSFPGKMGGKTEGLEATEQLFDFPFVMSQHLGTAGAELGNSDQQGGANIDDSTDTPVIGIPASDTMLVVDEQLSETVGDNGTDIFQNDYEVIPEMVTESADEHMVELEEMEPFQAVDVQTENVIAADISSEDETLPADFVNPIALLKPSRFDENIGTTEFDYIDTTPPTISEIQGQEGSGYFEPDLVALERVGGSEPAFFLNEATEDVIISTDDSLSVLKGPAVAENSVLVASEIHRGNVDRRVHSHPTVVSFDDMLREKELPKQEVKTDQQSAPFIRTPEARIPELNPADLIPETSSTEATTLLSTKKAEESTKTTRPTTTTVPEASTPLVVSEAPWERRPNDSPLPSVLQSLFNFLGGARRDAVASTGPIRTPQKAERKEDVPVNFSKRVESESVTPEVTSSPRVDVSMTEPPTTQSRVLNMNGPSAIIRPHSNLGLNSEELRRLKLGSPGHVSRSWGTLDDASKSQARFNKDTSEEEHKSKDGSMKLYQFLKSQPLPVQNAILRGLPEASQINATKAMRKMRTFSEETVDCDWKIKTDPGLYILVTFHNISAPYSVDCHGAYIEVERESNGYEARWCGERVSTGGGRPHVIFARRELRITVFQSATDGKRAKLPTGFSAEVEVVDLFEAVQQMDFKRSSSYSSVRRLNG